MYKKLDLKEISNDQIKLATVVQRSKEIVILNKVHNDAMKYQGLLRRVTCARYKVEGREYDLLLFLNSEGMFTMREFASIAGVYGLYVQMFNQLVNNGHIIPFRDQAEARAVRSARLYTVAPMWRHRINYLYSVLNFENEYTEDLSMETKTSGFRGPKMIKAIRKMNKDIRAKQLAQHQKTRRRGRKPLV